MDNSKNKNLIVILIIVVVLGVGGYFTYNYFKNKDSNETTLLKVYKISNKEYKTTLLNGEKALLTSEIPCESSTCTLVGGIFDIVIINDNGIGKIYDTTSKQVLYKIENYGLDGSSTFIDNETASYCSDIASGKITIDGKSDNTSSSSYIAIKTSNNKLGVFSLKTKKVTVPIEYDNGLYGYCNNYYVPYNNSLVLEKKINDKKTTEIVNYETGEIILSVVGSINCGQDNLCIVYNSNDDTTKTYDVENRKYVNGNITFDDIYITGASGSIALLNNNLVVVDKDGKLIKTLVENFSITYKDFWMASGFKTDEEKDTFLLFAPPFNDNSDEVADTNKCLSISYNFNTKKEEVIKNALCSWE